MPRIIPQADDLGRLPRLNDEKQAPRMIRAGRHKWQELRDKIPYIRIGRSRFWTDEVLLEFLRNSTVQPPALEPKRRRTLPRKAVSVPPKGRRRKADQGERVAQ